MLTPEQLVHLRSMRIETTRKARGILAGQYDAKRLGQGLSFHEVRPYQPGDDIRRMDWNVSARTMQPHIKVFTEEKELTLYVVLDTSRSMQFGSRRVWKSELATETVAALAHLALTQGDPVGMVATGKTPRIIQPRKSGDQWTRLVQASAEQGHDGPLADALGTLAKVGKRRGVVFVISDFLAPLELPHLGRLAQRHDVVPIWLSDVRERELPDVGLIQLHDPETGETADVDTSNPKVRALYNSTAARMHQARMEAFRKAGLSPVEMSTDSTPIEPLRAYFSRRAKRRSR